MNKKTESATTVTQIRLLTDVYFQAQKLRVAVGNRIDAVMRSADRAERS
jgi:hypothetical protein